ncbi:MAG: DUF2325 domain-containing protein [Lachnospiraceae bacterium]|nr:DUF2325 domain-containing protein [Lachnospiraceae bacterium]
MSVVIIGGHECMERQYKEICKKHGCKSKVFCKYKTGMESRIGMPDLLILFTHTVSHKAVKSAVAGVPESTDVVWSHSSSQSALYSILDKATNN